MATYKHGTYADIAASAAKSATSTGTIAVYVGVAPVNLVKEYKTQNVVNFPVKLSNFTHAQKCVGFSDDWDNFTLAEPIAAHFDNRLGNIGPIYVINVLDPETHRKPAQTVKTLKFVNKKAEFLSDTAILDTVEIDGLTADEDFLVDYNFTSGKVVIESLNDADPLDGNVQVKFYEVDPSLINEDTIIGGKTAGGEYSGIGALPLIYQKLGGKVPNLLCVPKYQESKRVYQAMLTAIQKINDQWDAFAVGDLPLTCEVDTNISIHKYTADVSGVFYTADEIAVGTTAYKNRLLDVELGEITAVDTTAGTVTIDGGNSETLTDGGPVKKTQLSTIDTIAEAIAYQQNNAFDGERSKIFWPQFYDAGTERIYHGSVLAIVEFLRADDTHKSVPCETCSNKEIPVTAQYFGAGSKNAGFDRTEANNLNEFGISTGFSDGGKFKLWGGHTAKYTYGSDDDPRCIFDTYMRTLMYLENGFQKRHGSEIDKPFNIGLRDSILNDEQEHLDTLVSLGALIGEPKILFLASENSTEDMMTGDFTFDIPVTATPQFKSGTARVAYTDEGLSSLVEEG